jgi:hypothetical protein
MKQRTRIYYTEAQKTLIWEHWNKGHCRLPKSLKPFFLQSIVHFKVSRFELICLRHSNPKKLGITNHRPSFI